ncbi:hypothetical protein FKM82_003589 [Ascaphus truei]
MFIDRPPSPIRSHPRGVGWVPAACVTGLGTGHTCAASVLESTGAQTALQTADGCDRGHVPVTVPPGRLFSRIPGTRTIRR